MISYIWETPKEEGDDDDDDNGDDDVVVIVGTKVKDKSMTFQNFLSPSLCSHLPTNIQYFFTFRFWDDDCI